MAACAETIDAKVFRSRFWPKAVLVLLVHLLAWLAAVVNQSALTDDSIQYLLLAENWVEHGTFSQSYFEPFVEDVQRTPGYPLFLIASGRWIPLVLALQHVLSLLTAWWIFKGLKSFGNECAGRWAGWMYAIMPYPVIFASLILSETLFIFLLVAGVVECLAAIRNGGAMRMVLGSIAWGAAVLVRPVAWPMLLVLLLLMAGWVLREKKGRRVVALGMLVGLVLPGAWMLRNHGLTGNYTLSTMGGMGMLHGRLGGLEADRQGMGVDEHNLYMCGDSIAAQEIGFPALREYPPSLQTHETERFDPRVNRITFAFFLDHPWDAAIFQVKRLGAMLGGIGYGWAKKVTASTLIAGLVAGIQGLFNLFMYAGLALALWNWWRMTMEDWLLTAMVMVALVVSAAAWSDGRYRMVVDGLMLMVACKVWVGGPQSELRT